MKSQPYHNFWQRIHKAAKNKGFPLWVMFELTYRCNFYCRYCYVPQSYKKEGELKTKEVFSILDQLKDIGCFYLGFTGGEPFMRKDILDILWYAKRCGFEVIIYTNGSLINKAMAIQLTRLRPNKVDITIPAMSKENFERITQMPGSHKKVFSAIDFLYKKRVNLGFKTCVLKENEEEMGDIQDFAADLGALHRLDDLLSPRLDDSKEPYKYRGRLSNNANIREYNENPCECITPGNIRVHARAINKNSHAISENSQLFKCGVGVGQVAITPFGELKMCVMKDYPKYKILTNNRLAAQTANRTANTANRVAKVNLKQAWEKLKKIVKNIKLNRNYQRNTCKAE